MTEKWSLRTRVFLFFALIGLGALLAITVALWLATQRIGGDASAPLVLFGGAAVFAIAGLVLWVWWQFDEHVARPILALAAALRQSVHTGTQSPLSKTTGQYLGLLAPAVQELTTALTDARSNVEAERQQARDEADTQRARLEAILRDLDQGVVLCGFDHRVLLYNRHALRTLHAAGDIGLGRSFLELVEPQPFRHGIERLTRRHASGRHIDHAEGLSTDLVGQTRGGRHMLRGRLSLTLDAENLKPIGYSIVFDDVTNELAAGLWRDRLLHDINVDMRRRIANLALASELLAEDKSLEAPARQRLERLLVTETRALSERLDRLDEASGDLLASAWPMGNVFSPTLLTCAASRRSEQRQIEVEIAGDPVWLHCDSASITELLDRLINRIAVWGDLRQFTIAAIRDGDRAHVDLGWHGAAVPMASLEIWLDEPLEALGSGTLRDVINRHRSDCWSEQLDSGAARLRVPLGVATDYYWRPKKASGTIFERPEFYDFDLAGREIAGDLDDRPLRDLTFVVFDTETTGLEPSAGDRMISIAGVRIVNGRMLRGEVFNTRIDPGRPIPAKSTKIHGIDDAMVRGAPGVEEVLPRFHRFVADAVLVAHNAPFDMKFLTLSQDACGVSFGGPVLDTVLLAAEVYGASESLTLDALATRFGVIIPPEDRHTALGDAIATAVVFLKLLDLLHADGIATLRDARALAERQAALRRKQSAY